MKRRKKKKREHTLEGIKEPFKTLFLFVDQQCICNVDNAHRWRVGRNNNEFVVCICDTVGRVEKDPD